MMNGGTMSTLPKLSKRELFKRVGYEPHVGQIAVHRSRAPRRVLACGVRFGKTLAAAMEGIYAAMLPSKRSMGWVCAPTYDLAEKVFREIFIVCAEKFKHRIVTAKEHDRRLVLRNMGGGVSEIRGKSADNPVSLLGEGLDWLIIDEAARLKSTIWEAYLSQRLLDKKGWALMISTPRGKGWFFDAWRRGQGRDSDFESWNLPSWTNPHVSRELIENERSRLADRVFRQEYGGEFIEGAGQVFRNVRECATGEFQPPEPDVEYYAGLDLAKVEDFSVLVIMNSAKQVVFTDRFHRLDWADQVRRIKAALTVYNGASVAVDATGVGGPICEALAAAGVSVVAVCLTAQSKTALIDNLGLLLEQQRIVLPRPEVWPEGVDELEAYEFSLSEQGHVRTNAPSGMHDDAVIALALAAAHAEDQPASITVQTFWPERRWKTDRPIQIWDSLRLLR